MVEGGVSGTPFDTGDSAAESANDGVCDDGVCLRGATLFSAESSGTVVAPSGTSSAGEGGVGVSGGPARKV